MNFETFKKKYQKVSVEHYPHSITEEPVVSVCVQTYQHADYIVDCLEGILMQETDFSFAILLGEDASTDGTRDICIKYAKKYPENIKLFLHDRENNIEIGGQPTGRFNFLYNLYSARGKYIALCDGDDYWTDPQKLQKQVGFLENDEDYVGCFSNFMIVDRNSNVLKKKGLLKKKQRDLDISSILEFQSPKTLTTVFRRKVLPTQYCNEYRKVFNFDTFLFSLLARENPFKYLDFTSGAYREHSEGIWSENNEILQNEKQLHTFMLMKNVFDDDHEQLAISRRILRKRLKLIPLYIKKGHFIKALRFAKKVYSSSEEVSVYRILRSVFEKLI